MAVEGYNNGNGRTLGVITAIIPIAAALIAAGSFFQSVTSFREQVGAVVARIDDQGRRIDAMRDRMDLIDKEMTIVNVTSKQVEATVDERGPRLAKMEHDVDHLTDVVARHEENEKQLADRLQRLDAALSARTAPGQR